MRQNISGQFHALDAYPVGAVYMSFNDTSPAELFGGTWVRIEGRFLLAADSSHAVSGTGGAASVTSGGTVLAMNQLPARSILLYPPKSDGTGRIGHFGGLTTESTNNFFITDWGSAKSGGLTSADADQPHTHTVNTMPPYVAVYVWRRTA